MVTELLLPKRGIAVPKPPSYIRGDWRFSEGSGLFLGDHSRYRNHGTIVDATWSTDRKPGCLDFDGTTDYVNCGASASLNITGAITVEMWVKLTDTATYQSLVAKLAAADGAFQFAFAIHPNDSPYYLNPNSGWKGFPDLVITYGAWQHIVFSYDGTNMRAYLNGDVSGYVQAVTAPTSRPTYPLFVGATWAGGNAWLKGLVGEVRVLGIALSASEVKARYNATS